MKEIRSQEELDRILELSQTKPVILYKHSATCPISRWAYHQMEQGIQNGMLPSDDVYMVVVQQSRSVSNEIARRLQIQHESPQVLVVLQGKCIYHDSHYGIDSKIIQKVLNHEGEIRGTNISRGGE